VAATMASLHMRTWFNALPGRHHAGAASLGGSPREQPTKTKSAFRCREYPVHRTRSPM